MTEQKHGDMLRAFIALELQEEARAKLLAIIDTFKKANADIKWVQAESIHLTLKFLGSVPEPKISDIGERLKAIASHIKPFELVIGGDIGVFPNWDYAKVLWIAASAGSGHVIQLAEQIETAMADEGFEREKRAFSAHITLGRFRSAKNKDALKNIASLTQVPTISVNISQIVLFRSDLTPRGARYTPVKVVDLL